MIEGIDGKVKLYNWEGLAWDVDYDINGYDTVYARCPIKGCHCRLNKSKGKYEYGEYRYECPKCGRKFILGKPAEEMAKDFSNVLDAKQYEEAEIINIDGDLIRVQREVVKDEDYWVDAKISKNKKGELQLMVLAGSRKDGDKAQLFLDPTHERLGFDQNNDHPAEVFSVVTAVFKNSRGTIDAK
ncbi:MAG: hypothetical protein WCO23_00655 [bacterium]